MPRIVITHGPATLAKNLATAAVSEAKAILAHQPPVSAEEAARRLSICQGCEFFANDRCAKCGCYLRHKTAWRAQHCPINKW